LFTTIAGQSSYVSTPVPTKITTSSESSPHAQSGRNSSPSSSASPLGSPTPFFTPTVLRFLGKGDTSLPRPDLRNL
jgi:hypothetical protein